MSQKKKAKYCVVAAIPLSLKRMCEQRARTSSQNKQPEQAAQAINEALGRLLQDRGDHTVEIAAILGGHLKYTDAYSSDILDLRFELKDTISREEWTRIYGEQLTE